MARTDCGIWHVMCESYSVLTRLPGTLRVTPLAAAQSIGRRLPGQMLTLRSLDPGALEMLARADISAGATYDGLIALTARDHDVHLISRDRRAARTYAALGIRYELL